VAVVTIPLLQVAPATPRSRLLAADFRNKPFDFLPGHAVLIAPHGEETRRPYSIACSPERAVETGRLELLIALDGDGEAGSPLPLLSPGALLDIEGPLGTFIFPAEPEQRHLLFIAGGTGISPLRAMMDHALRRYPSHAVSVLYSARRSDEFAFIDELRRHAAAGRIELHQTVTRDESATWSGGRGRIGRAHFESVMHDPDATLCFVCGPRTMVSESVAVLQALGVPESAIRTEGWGAG
jgi:ring-1,2-phenylacetyl-CoA epoxidase subunit PaaE